jgi:signal transduction histidine kinase
MKNEDYAFLQGKSILTIDDSRTVNTFLSRLLSGFGANVDEAYLGYEAIAICSDRCYDIILLDLLLPDIDGLQVLQQIRGRNDECAIVLLTGAGGIATAIDAVRKGADGYLQKQEMAHTEYHQELLYVLAQALERRAGLIARKELENSKNDFYAKITHDLRSPTSAIITSVEMLLDEQYGALQPQQRELLEIVQRMGIRLFDLITGYLDFAKIEAGFLQLQPSQVDIRELVAASVRLAEIEMKQKEQTLSLELPPEPMIGHLDGKRFQQVVDNLLSNAIKYTGRGGKIYVHLYQDNNEAVLIVRDTGQGIPMEQLPGLFSKYHRVSSPDNAHVRGFGLGLFIVKEIVEAHGGSVSAESEGIPGKGSTFKARIPLFDKKRAEP